jgi:uncharacterized membrane protein
VAGRLKTVPSARFPHWVTWSVFIVLVLFAVLYVNGTAPQLPPTVASHFNAAGHPNAFMSRSGYTRFILCFAVGFPILIVAILTTVHSRATEMKLPNREYWLAPQRIGRTRAFVVAHGVWFGSLLVVLGCFVHWQELIANRLQPPHLSNATFAAGLIAFLVATTVWVAVLMFAFRRPVGE